MWSQGSAQNSALTVRRPVASARGFSNVAAQAPGRWTGRARPWATNPLKMGARTSRRGFRFSSKRSNSQGGKEAEEAPSLSARLKKLSREYGWSAVGVYLGLSVLDFPFCFLLVRTVGTDRIGEAILYRKMIFF